MNKPVHYVHALGYRSACGTLTGNMLASTDPGQTTCLRCPSTIQWKQAWAKRERPYWCAQHNANHTKTECLAWAIVDTKRKAGMYTLKEVEPAPFHIYRCKKPVCVCHSAGTPWIVGRKSDRRAIHKAGSQQAALQWLAQEYAEHKR